jgi:hypothetical protein
MAVWYLDNDDEITDAVARLRAADDEQVVFVVPPGSRIATGRINFKLLAREAESRELRMAIASPDEQVRALATSAGVLTAVTPDQATAALERGDQAPEPTTADEPAPATPASTSETDASAGGFFSWRSQRLRVTTIVALAVFIIAGYVLSQALPTAEITLTPRVVMFGPIEAAVTATTDVTEPDLEAATIPATILSIPLTAEITHPSSGTEETVTGATGSVVFSSPSQAFDQTIEAGTRVRTPGGTEFRTTETVTLPRSEDGALAQVAAPVEALEGGEVGNVDPGAISLVPTLESQGVSVDNPEATSGGRSESSPLVEPGDYDDAVANLKGLLDGELNAYLADPANGPDGLTVFPETATRGQVSLDPPADTIVGSALADFTLTGSAEARVLTVDESAIRPITLAHLAAAVPAGLQLVDDGAAASHGEGIATGESILFEGKASGWITPVIDIEALRSELAGLPVSDARAILEGLGAATVNVWPEFMGDLPNDRQRITLDVREASTTE